MILAVKNGKLIPPASPAKGRERELALAGECRRIKKQLEDPTRRDKAFPAGGAGEEEYHVWRNAAEQALRMHNKELRLLQEWLQGQQLKMLSDASHLFTSLIEDGTDFDDEEMHFIRKLNQYVGGEQ